MISRHFDTDAVTGAVTTFHYDDDGTVTLETKQDVTELVDLNKDAFAATDERARWGELTRVASIPLPLYFTLKQQGIIDDPKRLREWLNDPDNRFFRVRPGRV